MLSGARLHQVPELWFRTNTRSAEHSIASIQPGRNFNQYLQSIRAKLVSAPPRTKLLQLQLPQLQAADAASLHLPRRHVLPLWLAQQCVLSPKLPSRFLLRPQLCLRRSTPLRHWQWGLPHDRLLHLHRA
jgi:hypothetical protein